MSNNFYDDLKNCLLNNIPRSKVVSGGKEILCRCPFCLDSEDPRSAHFYIRIYSENNEPPVYFCQKCQETGLFDSRILRIFNIYDSTINGDLNLFIKKTTAGNNNRLYKSNGIHVLRNDYILNHEKSYNKLKYINDRLGLSLSFKDLSDNKIVINLYDLLSNNNIQNITRKQFVTNLLDEYFIGFISYDNGYINMRNTLNKGILDKSVDKRYINYNIFNNIDNSKRYYIIPNKINILDTNPIEVHIAEGPFDILGIFYNIFNGDKYQKIYGAIGGRSYINLIRFIIESLGLINIDLHIYVDGDVKEYDINKIRFYVEFLNINTWIHRNIYPGEKDYGVPREKIKDFSYQITKRV